MIIKGLNKLDTIYIGWLDEKIKEQIFSRFIWINVTETLLNRSKMKENWMNLDIQKSYLLKDN